MKRLRPFFPYYGSKWRLAPKYPAPLHGTIIEPFAGSAQYATLYHDRKVVLCDLSEYVCGVWDYLIKATESDILRLPSVVDCVDDFPELCQEEKWLIGFWLYGGERIPVRCVGQSVKTRLLNGNRENCYWSEKCKQSLARRVHYIKHWQIRHCDCQQLDNPYATWFIDPPYNNRNGARYKHQFEHRALHGWVLSRMGQIIVCENYGAWWLPFQPIGYVISSRGLESREVVYHAQR